VNIGDLMQHWSNDILISNEHRVVAPPVTDPEQKVQVMHLQRVPPTHSSTYQFYDARYTVVFFATPNFDAEISCIPTCASADNPPKVIMTRFFLLPSKETTRLTLYSAPTYKQFGLARQSPWSHLWCQKRLIALVRHCVMTLDSL